MNKRKRKAQAWCSDDDEDDEYDVSEDAFLKEIVKEVEASNSLRCSLCKRYKKRDVIFSPRDKIEAALWATVISPKIKKPHQVCQKHFHNDNFVYLHSKIDSLVAGSVPEVPDDIKNKDKNAGGPYENTVDPKWFCAVKTCKNHDVEDTFEIATFQARGKLERELWSLSLQTSLHPKSRVCQRHFNDFYIEPKTVPRGRVKLKEGAIPDPDHHVDSDSSDDDAPLRPPSKRKVEVPISASDSDSEFGEDGLPLSALRKIKKESMIMKQELLDKGTEGRVKDEKQVKEEEDV